MCVCVCSTPQIIQEDSPALGALASRMSQNQGRGKDLCKGTWTFLLYLVAQTTHRALLALENFPVLVGPRKEIGIPSSMNEIRSLNPA